jgi:hypothetical protein
VLIIGTWERFSRGKQIGTYVGMIPSEDSSSVRVNTEQSTRAVARPASLRHQSGLIRTPRKFAASHREDIIRACDNLCGM